MITLSTDLIFLAIIVVYAIVGARKGCIKSIGGLIAMVLSWIISRAAALPVTIELFKNFNLEAKITEFMSMINMGIVESGNLVNEGVNISLFTWGPFTKLTEAVNNVFNTTALNIGSMLVTIVLFAICMLIFGMIVKVAQAAFEKIPMGKTMNSVFGLICGLIKGLIIALIIFFLISCVNSILQINIPINDCFLNKVIFFIRNLRY